MIRVLVVDDSVLVRRLVVTSLGLDPEIEVVGIAENGKIALDKVDELAPDAVTLDIEMPVLDGLGALEQLRRQHPRLPVIMFSTLTEKGATKTLEALSLGASDFVTKPSNTTSMEESMASVREQLIPKIKALTAVRRLASGAPREKRPAVTAAPVRTALAPPTTQRAEVLLIGCSTGGPDALSRVLEELPGTLGVPVLVVQHMPPLFTTMFAERLDRVSALAVREAAEGDVPRAGEVLVAPGGFHLRLRESAGTVRATLDEGPPENFCRPAVDALFRSAAQVYGGRAAALILTGMGSDGLEGCRLLGSRGARIVVQDEASSVVWGMPGAVASAGLAHDVLPLEHIAGKLTGLLS